MTTPWNNQLVSLLIITAPSGAYAGIFVYSPSPGTGNLIGSWAAQAGTDPYGNAYPAGLDVTVGTITGVTISGGTISGGTITGATISSTVFNGTNFILNSSGFFFYSGTPALGNLATSVANVAGTDSFGNTYPAGFDGQQLTLTNQSGTPPAVSGAGVLFSNSGGKLRFLHSTGNNNFLQRSDPNISQTTIGNVTTANPISTSITYQANEGQVGSEYEIEADGVLQTGTVAAVSISFGVAVDGTILGGQVTVGATYLVISSSFWYTLRGRLTILTTGSGGGGTCVITTDGAMGKQGANAGASTSFPVTYTPMGATSGGTSKLFDTTVTHTITLYAQWAGTNTGQVLTTYRQRATRRG